MMACVKKEKGTCRWFCALLAFHHFHLSCLAESLIGISQDRQSRWQIPTML
jgi:hypothetical protein